MEKSDKPDGAVPRKWTIILALVEPSCRTETTPKRIDSKVRPDNNRLKWFNFSESGLRRNADQNRGHARGHPPTLTRQDWEILHERGIHHGTRTGSFAVADTIPPTTDRPLYRLPAQRGSLVHPGQAASGRPSRGPNSAEIEDFRRAFTPAAFFQANASRKTSTRQSHFQEQSRHSAVHPPSREDGAATHGTARSSDQPTVATANEGHWIGKGRTENSTRTDPVLASCILIRHTHRLPTYDLPNTDHSS